MNHDAIVIKESDNVATALHDLPYRQQASVGIGDETITVMLVEDIELGHKLAIRKISRGQNIIKYGEIIGRATGHIVKSTHTHVQNIESLRGRGDMS